MEDSSSQARRPVVLSHGGGLDSAAMLRDAINRGELPDYCVHVDTGAPGDPGEWPGTMKYLDEVTRPLCEEHGIKFLILDGENYPVRGARSLFAWLSGDRGPDKPRAAVQIPVTGPGRICTIVAKVERFESWLDDTFPGQEVEVWIGFEAGEEARADKDPNSGTRRKPKPHHATRVNRFPLIEGKFCRCRCERLVRASGKPVPRKSACVYCPYASKGDWQTFAKELPEQFAQVAALEAAKPPTRSGKKLSIMGYSTVKLSKAQAIALAQVSIGSIVKRASTAAVLVRYELVENGPSGLRLTEKGQEALSEGAGARIGYKAPPLSSYIEGDYKGGKKGCTVCGAKVRATKATACGFLSDDEAVEDEAAA